MYCFAIIGCGEISGRHADAIRKVGKLSAVCDIIPQRADSAGKLYNCRVYYTIEDLLQKETDLNVISICTPNGIHAEHIIKSLQAYKDIYCETPFCITSAAAWQIIETAKFSRRQFFLANRFRNHFTGSLIEHITAKPSGVTFRLNCYSEKPYGYYSGWRGKEFPGGGILYTEFSNYINIISCLFGEAEEIFTSTSNHGYNGLVELEDNGTATLKMENGATGIIEWSVNKIESATRLEIITPEKTYVFTGAQLDSGAGKTGEFDEEKFYMDSYSQIVHSLENNNMSKDIFIGMQAVSLIEKIYRSRK
jgi:UDP-N-acetyl-2-amino-2-deoxyglucuronate dehydrogenase